MLKPKYIEQLPNNLVDLYSQAEIDIIIDIARRITTYDFFIPSAEYQYRKLQDMGLLYDEILKKLTATTGIAKEQLESLIKEAGAEALKNDDSIYRKAGKIPTPLDSNPAMRLTLTAGIKKTNGLFENLTKTTANTATKQFENALDRAYMQITSGAFDYNSSIRMTLKDLCRKGIAVVEYPTGHVDYIETAIRRAVVTGINQTTGVLQEQRADEMGNDLVEVTAHAGARDTGEGAANHASWQGKIYSRSGNHQKYPSLVEVTGYGTGEGLKGWNCRHDFFPYIEGVSEPGYSKKELKEMETPKYEYNSKKLNEYEATQKQRYIERQIRRWKREEEAMKAIDFPTDESTAKVREWQGIQKDFIKQTGLKRQYDREQIGKTVVNTSNSDIIKLGKISENHLEKLSLEEVKKFNGKLSNRATRKWYKYNDEQIEKLIDKSKSLEEQARQACQFRNQYRTQARDLMRDQEERHALDKKYPNQTFEQLLERKQLKYGLTGEEAYNDILRSSQTTNKKFDRKAGLNNEGNQNDHR